MNSGIIKALAVLAILSMAWPMGASAADQNYSDWNKPAWEYQQSDWWQAFGAQPGQPAAAREREDSAHFRYWREHHRETADQREYRWQPNPYSYVTSFTPPDSLYYRQYNPSYGYMMPWSFYVTPYR